MMVINEKENVCKFIYIYIDDDIINSNFCSTRVMFNSYTKKERKGCVAILPQKDSAEEPLVNSFSLSVGDRGTVLVDDRMVGIIS